MLAMLAWWLASPKADDTPLRMLAQESYCYDAKLKNLYSANIASGQLRIKNLPFPS